MPPPLEWLQEINKITLYKLYTINMCKLLNTPCFSQYTSSLCTKTLYTLYILHTLHMCIMCIHITHITRVASIQRHICRISSFNLNLRISWRFLFLFLFLFFRAAPVLYGGSQAKGRIRATAARLHHSHSSQFQATSVTYTTAHGNARFLTHWARPGIKYASLWILVRFISDAPQWELWRLLFQLNNLSLWMSFYFFNNICIILLSTSSNLYF